jgi:hypothetical protein
LSTHTQAAHDRCRTFGHAWFEVDADKRSSFGYYLWLRCERCDAVRMDTIDVHGELGARSYRYPEGYKESEKIAKSDYRLRTLVAHRTRTGKVPKQARSLR